jgi:hypothetical protein
LKEVNYPSLLRAVGIAIAISTMFAFAVVPIMFIQSEVVMRMVLRCLSGFFLFVAMCHVAFAGGISAPDSLVVKLAVTNPISIDVKWSGPVNQGTMYRVFRSVDDTLHFSVAATIPVTVFHDWMVAAGHSFNYKVKAFAVSRDTVLAESPFSATAGVAVPLPPGKPKGNITGVISDSLTGVGLPQVQVQFFRRASLGATSMTIPDTWTDKDGKYAITLDTGMYLVRAVPLPCPWKDIFTNPPYKAKWYGNAYELGAATPVKADTPAFVANIGLVKVTAPPTVTISGVVRDSAGKPVGGATVALMRTVQEMNQLFCQLGPNGIDRSEDFDLDDFGHLRGVLWNAKTDSNGAYSATVLSGRTYLALATKQGYFTQFYNHKTSVFDATIIRIPTPVKDTTGFDFNLAKRPAVQGFTVSGLVQDSAGVRVPSRIAILPVNKANIQFYARLGATDSLGGFTIKDVAPGKYFVFAVPYASFAPAFYKPGVYGLMKWQQADTVTVTAAVTGITIGVVPITATGVASLSGLVSTGGAAVQGANVLAMDSQGGVVGYGLTDEKGFYLMNNVPAGSISVSVDQQGFQAAQAPVTIGAMDLGKAQSFTINAVTTGVNSDAPVAVAREYALHQNYPNPFNPTTRIAYVVPAGAGSGLQVAGGSVRLTIYDLLGREVAVLVDGVQAPGRHEVTFDARHLSTGVYLYRLSAGDFVSMKKMMLVK